MWITVGVVVGDQVDHELTVALERVDVVEAEERLGLVDALELAGVAIDDDEARAALRLPLVVVDERLLRSGIVIGFTSSGFSARIT